MIYITGDTHADFSRLYRVPFSHVEEWEQGTDPHYVIICGDFGGVWNESMQQAAELDKLNDRPFTILFLDGNHENYDLLATYPVENWHGGKVQAIRKNVLHLMRGQIYEIEGQTFFIMGGAACHDTYNGVLDMDDPEFTQKYQRLKNARKFFRINHLSWWEQELPTESEISAAYETLCAYGKKVDYVLSHCAPSKMQRRIQARIGDSTHPKNALTEFLQWVYNECEFKHWYCGHYHQPMDITRCFHVVYENIVRLDGDMHANRQLEDLMRLLKNGHKVCYMLVSMYYGVKQININEQQEEYCWLFRECVNNGMTVCAFSFGMKESEPFVKARIDVRV